MSAIKGRKPNNAPTQNVRPSPQQARGVQQQRAAVPSAQQAVRPHQQAAARPVAQQQPTRAQPPPRSLNQQQRSLPQQYQSYQQPPHPYQSPQQEYQQYEPSQYQDYQPSDYQQPSQYPQDQLYQTLPQQPYVAPPVADGKIKVVHPDPMQINSELLGRLETLEDELSRTRQALGRAEEINKNQKTMDSGETGSKQAEETKKLKVALQEMGRVVKFLETELQKAQKNTNSDSRELSSKLAQEQAKNQEMSQRFEERINQEKGAAQNAVAEKERVLQELVFKLKNADTNVRELEEKCSRLQSGQSESLNSTARQYEEKFRAIQDQKKASDDKLKASANQVTGLLQTLKTKETAWKAQEGELEAKLKDAWENINGLQENEQQLQLDNKTKDERLFKSEQRLNSIVQESREDKVKLGQMEKIVQSLEDKLGKTEEKVYFLEQKLKEEKSQKEKVTKEELKNLKDRIKVAESAKAASEKKKIEADRRMKNLEDKYTGLEEELEDKRQRLSEMEVDCNEAVAKYKELQEKRSESSKNYIDAMSEVESVKKNCEEHTEKYEQAICNKARYEYQINFLEEKCRRLSNKPLPASDKPPKPVTKPFVPIANNYECPDVNEQFLALLDTDTAVKFKELDDKNKEIEKLKITSDQKLEEEKKRSDELQKFNTELKKEIEIIEDLKKENAELHMKIEEALANDIDAKMSKMHADPAIDNESSGNGQDKVDEMLKQLEVKALADRQTIETLERELEERREISEPKTEELFSEHEGMLDALRSLPTEKRKRVFENIFDETKKLRFGEDTFEESDTTVDPVDEFCSDVEMEQEQEAFDQENYAPYSNNADKLIGEDEESLTKEHKTLPIVQNSLPTKDECSPEKGDFSQVKDQTSVEIPLTEEDPATDDSEDETSSNKEEYLETEDPSITSPIKSEIPTESLLASTPVVAQGVSKAFTATEGDKLTEPTNILFSNWAIEDKKEGLDEEHDEKNKFEEATTIDTPLSTLEDAVC